jgi:NAD(P)-dependent dehydrogenase (short-subunit alcohol dehydrogenase family)
MATWDHILRINLTGYMLCCRHAIPHLLRRGGGAIVCTSSNITFGLSPAMVSYNVAKSGVTGLVRHVAGRWGKEGVRCNAVSPGAVESETWVRATEGADWIDKEKLVANLASTRLGLPSDIAAAVAYLLSDDAIWVNGQLIAVNGGSFAH